MASILETAGTLLNTPQKRELAHRGLNLVFAVAAFNSLHHTETTGELLITALSLYTFAYEALSPDKNNGILGLINGSAATLSFFTNPFNTIVHGYNAVRRGVNSLEEVAEEYRRESGYRH